MTSYTTNGHVRVNRRMLSSGAALVAVGGLIGFAGMAIGGLAVLAAVREYVNHMDRSPREIAAQRWRQAKSASMAGVSAWRDATD